MISFIKKLFGIGSIEPLPSTTAAPYKIEPPQSTGYIEPAKPVFKSEAGTPAKKNRRPRNRNKAKPVTPAAPPTPVQKAAPPAKVAKVKSTQPKQQQTKKSK